MARRSWPRGLVASVIAVVLTFILAGTVAADSTVWSNVTHTPLKSKCVGKDAYGNPTITWRGGDTEDYGSWPPSIWAPHGKLYLCYTIFRLGSTTSDGDYYGVDLFTKWTSSGEWNWESAITSQSVSSNTTTKDSVFDWTPSFTANQSCTSLSIGFSAGPISISTPSKLCSGEHVSVSGWSKGAAWTVIHAANIRTLETMYFQKVAHGAKPTFNIWFEIPYYTYTSTNGYWQITSRAWKNYIYNVGV